VTAPHLPLGRELLEMVSCNSMASHTTAQYSLQHRRGVWEGGGGE